MQAQQLSGVVKPLAQQGGRQGKPGALRAGQGQKNALTPLAATSRDREGVSAGLSALILYLVPIILNNVIEHGV